MAKLNDQTARYNNGKARPCRIWHVLPKDKSAAYYAYQGEYGYIDSQKPGKIPSHRVHEQPIACQHEATGQDNDDIGPAQTFSNHRIASDLQEGRTQED
jgi:hypothetical protein